MTVDRDPASLVAEHFGSGANPSLVSVPGRANLIGEHIDYHNLPVLPIAIQRRIRIAFRARGDRRIRAVSEGPFGEREFEWTEHLAPGRPGDWVNYLKAAAQAAAGRWHLERGIDAVVVSDLPPAAGLASSSALLTGFTLALLRANGVHPTFEELMEVLPDGEQFVGTRGGAMDHAAVLRSKSGCALLVHFAPLSVCSAPIPQGWAFLVAHSLTTAEKSGAIRAQFNSRRTAGSRALKRLGFASYGAALEEHPWSELRALAGGQLDEEEMRSFLHVAGEALRVNDAIAALRDADAGAFGQALNASHESLRDQLRVSCPALDALVAVARDSGALGARLTGAGFGGCAVIFCDGSDLERVRAGLVRRYYAKCSGFDPDMHLITAEPSAGALLD
jgi:galactokinase